MLSNICSDTPKCIVSIIIDYYMFMIHVHGMISFLTAHKRMMNYYRALYLP